MLRMLVFIWCLCLLLRGTRVQEGVCGHRPVLEGGREGGGGAPYGKCLFNIFVHMGPRFTPSRG